VQTATVELDTADGPMDCYEVVPDGEVRRGAVVIQEAFGVNDHIEEVARRLAATGCHVVAPHVFHRAGGGTAPYGDFSKVLPLFERLDDRGILVDVDAALTRLQAAGHEPARVGIVGFCFGGRVTFLAALERALGAAVGFYGGGIVSQRFPRFPALIDRARELKTPWLGLFGGDDESIPVDDVERLRAELVGVDVETEIVCYPGVGHGFHCDVRDS
jgi:carboxymethylenebutenolidase